MRIQIIAFLVIVFISSVNFAMEESRRRNQLFYTQSERSLPRLSDEKVSENELDKATGMRSKSYEQLHRVSSLKNLFKKNSSRNELSRSTPVLTRSASSSSFGHTNSDLSGSLHGPSDRSSNRSASPVSCLRKDVNEAELQGEIFRLANYSTLPKEEALKKLKLIHKRGLKNLSVFDKYGFTPLRMAAKKGREGIVKALLELHVDPDISCSGDNTALIDAATGGHSAIVAILIVDAGAKIEAHNRKGETALWCAAIEKHLETVKVLMREKANVNHVIGGQTLLIWAIKDEYFELVDQLIQNNADVNFVDRYGKTALDYAQATSEKINKNVSAPIEKKFACERIVTMLKDAQEKRKNINE